MQTIRLIQQRKSYLRMSKTGRDRKLLLGWSQDPQLWHEKMGCTVTFCQPQLGTCRYPGFVEREADASKVKGVNLSLQEDLCPIRLNIVAGTFTMEQILWGKEAGPILPITSLNHFRKPGSTMWRKETSRGKLIFQFDYHDKLDRKSKRVWRRRITGG